MKKLGHIFTFVMMGLQSYACSPSAGRIIDEPDSAANDTITNAKDMKLKITIGDKIATAVLYDNPTSRDFAGLLPLTIKMDDYAHTEKIFYPSRKLSVRDAPPGFDPLAGDITLYAPWGNVALFYKDFGYSNGLISMGKITDGIEAFAVKGSITVKIEWIK